MASSFKDKYEKIKARAAGLREKATEKMGQVLQTAEVGGSAFIFSFLRGKMGDENGELDVAGVPVSLGSGLVLHLAGFAGLFGKHDEHAHNLGDGAIAEYLTVMGLRMGAERSDFSGSRRIAGGRARSVAGLNQGYRGNNRHPWEQGSPYNPAWVR